MWIGELEKHEIVSNQFELNVITSSSVDEFKTKTLYSAKENFLLLLAQHMLLPYHLNRCRPSHISLKNMITNFLYIIFNAANCQTSRKSCQTRWILTKNERVILINFNLPHFFRFVIITPISHIKLIKLVMNVYVISFVINFERIYTLNRHLTNISMNKNFIQRLRQFVFAVTIEGKQN